MNLGTLSETDLIRMHADVIAELRRREVVRTGNNPIGDYTEWLAANRLGLHLVGNSQASFDATDTGGRIRYQIKGRRSIRPSGNVQFSVIRNLDNNPFDFLIAVIFHADYSVRFAAQIPLSVIREVATYRAHVNGHVPILRETILRHPDVIDITDTMNGLSGSL